MIEDGNAKAAKAETDAATAYTALGTQACTTSYGVPTDLGGMTLTPGVYCFASSAALTGTLTLDAGGNPNAVWVFQIGSTLTTASASSVQLANSAQFANVYWAVGSSATLGTGSAFDGNILAVASITLNTSATLSGRALAQNGAVTLDSNMVSLCACVGPYAAVTSTVVKTIPVPGKGGPSTVFGATLSPDGQNVWVAGSNGNSSAGFVSLIGVQSLQVGNSAAVGKGPSDISFSFSGGRAFVTNYQGSSLSVLSVKGLTTQQTIDLSQIPLSNPFGMVQAGGQLFVTTQGTSNQGSNNEVGTLAIATPLSIGTAVPFPGQSGRPAFIPAAAASNPGSILIPVFVTGTGPGNGHPTLVVVNPKQNTVSAQISLSSSIGTPEAVVVSPDGLYAYVTLFSPGGGTGGVWVVSLKGHLATKTVIRTCDPENFGEALSKDGKYLLVAGFSQEQVALIDTATDTVDALINVGNNPNAIALASGDSEAFVTNQKDGTVTVVSFAPSL